MARERATGIRAGLIARGARALVYLERTNSSPRWVAVRTSEELSRLGPFLVLLPEPLVFAWSEVDHRVLHRRYLASLRSDLGRERETGFLRASGRAEDAARRPRGDAYPPLISRGAYIPGVDGRPVEPAGFEIRPRGPCPSWRPGRVPSPEHQFFPVGSAEGSHRCDRCGAFGSVVPRFRPVEN